MVGEKQCSGVVNTHFTFYRELFVVTRPWRTSTGEVKTRRTSLEPWEGSTSDQGGDSTR